MVGLSDMRGKLRARLATLVQELRSQPAYRYVPLLILTTDATAESKERGKKAGVTGWLMKPFNRERLLAVVEKVLR